MRRTAALISLLAGQPAPAGAKENPPAGRHRRLLVARAPVTPALAPTLAALVAVAGVLAWPALAAEPPAAIRATPHVVEPRELSGPASEDCLSITADGRTAVYDLAAGKNAFIVLSHRARAGGSWSKPEIAPFSGRWYDHDPAISADGSFVVFASNRPAVETPGAATSGALWRVDRKGSGWGEPVRLPDAVNTSPRIYAPTIARDGSLYFIHPDAAGVQHIYRSQYEHGTYGAATPVVVGNPAGHQKDPGIAPDESFVVFDANDPVKNDPDRLFIAFREGDGFGPAIDLGDDVNAGNNPWGPHVDPDGHTLYYTSDRTVPVAYPRDSRQAKMDFARLLQWDDGESNVWALDLAPWIAAHERERRAAGH